MAMIVYDVQLLSKVNSLSNLGMQVLGLEGIGEILQKFDLFAAMMC